MISRTKFQSKFNVISERFESQINKGILKEIRQVMKKKQL